MMALRFIFHGGGRLAGRAAAGAAVLAAAGCSGGGDGEASGGGDRIQAGKYVILGTQTDGADASAAKKNAENTLLKYPEVDAMVGLYAYNAPQCLEALKDTGKAGEVKLYAFDEKDETLQGIKDGHIVGTIVQQPFAFGYQATKYLDMLHRGEEPEVPENRQIDIPARTITQENVAAFREEVDELQRIGREAADAARPESDTRFAFITNNTDSFWNFARAGCLKAEQDFGVRVDFEMPAQASSSDQNRILENILDRGGYDGVAITVINPADQVEKLNAVAAEMPLITHDSDAPQSERLFYLGTNNYDAGRLLGRLIKETMPEGGEIMIFVGNIDVANASERRQGMIDELSAE